TDDVLRPTANDRTFRHGSLLEPTREPATPPDDRGALHSMLLSRSTAHCGRLRGACYWAAKKRRTRGRQASRDGMWSLVGYVFPWLDLGFTLYVRWSFGSSGRSRFGRRGDSFGWAVPSSGRPSGSCCSTATRSSPSIG